MKVAEMIEKLQGFNPESTVWMPDWNEGYVNPARVADVRTTAPGDWLTEEGVLGLPDTWPKKPPNFDADVVLVTEYDTQSR